MTQLDAMCARAWWVSFMLCKVRLYAISSAHSALNHESEPAASITWWID